MSGDIRKILKNHEKRISALEEKFRVKPRKIIPKKKKILTDYILELRDKGFFNQPRIAKEVHEKITDIYYSEFSRVKVELFRLAKRRQLRAASKTVSGKKYKAYVW